MSDTSFESIILLSQLKTTHGPNILHEIYVRRRSKECYSDTITTLFVLSHNRSSSTICTFSKNEISVLLYPGYTGKVYRLNKEKYLHEFKLIRKILTIL